MCFVFSDYPWCNRVRAYVCACSFLVIAASRCLLTRQLRQYFIGQAEERSREASGGDDTVFLFGRLREANTGF